MNGPKIETNAATRKAMLDGLMAQGCPQHAAQEIVDLAAYAAEQAIAAVWRVAFTASHPSITKSVVSPALSLVKGFADMQLEALQSIAAREGAAITVVKGSL